jgi:hypothetical protein
MQMSTRTPTKLIPSILAAIAAMAMAGFMLAGALATPANANPYQHGNWNEGCRSVWVTSEAWIQCGSYAVGLGQVKLTVDRAWQPDYDGPWRNPIEGVNTDYTTCLFDCRSAAVSRRGVG